jgi:ubiquitin-protein ligase
MEKKTTAKKSSNAERAASNQLARFIRNGGHPNIDIKKTNDPTIFYFMFKGLEGEYSTGVYLGELKILDKFPFVPPRVTMRTPTGVYPLNTDNFCISIGHYHPNDYMPGLGIDGFIRCILSGMEHWAELGNGINLLTTTSEVQTANIAQLATSSIEYNNIHNRHILALFE